jgi:serine/threonine-protein kinase
MIDPAIEAKVIRRALEEGYVTEQEVAQRAPTEPWGPRLSALVHAGLLSEPLVERLLAVVGSEKASSNGHERYERGELLGEGGMGQVYRAYDTTLKRPVALKFLRSDDPERIVRFLREAQAQARVDHQNVCKVYEVGELDGRPYIAMQLIQGEALPSPALAQMSVEEKVRILRDVAEAIHAAHRGGLIHRDIKPSNIMLERCEDGSFKPYVLDFGLAREVASAGATSMGLVSGTPHYMAPEQARGQSAALDRRTDVYGLGATLYALLSGHPPFEGPSGLDVLMKVTEEEAPRLTAVPEDLATIVAKCLQKEPAQRYDSARALAEDLGRYLDGEPIVARKASLRYRLLKKARKHRRLVAAGAVVAVAFLTLAILSLRTQLRAREQARLAGVFGQEVKAIEGRMRIAHLAPEHDITPEKTAIRQRMNAIEAQIQRIGGAAEGPGHYALGWGHLALKEYDQAREHLDRAWRSGYHEREAAYALAQVMGVLYQRELDVAERIADRRRREEKRAEAERAYRDPALAYLAQSRGLDVESPEYVEALVAFYERRYPDALSKARAAQERLPWLYEAWELEARVHSSQASEATYVGWYDDAVEELKRAEAALRSGMEVGRSDPALSGGLCRLGPVWISMASYGRGGDVEPQFDKALLACDRTIRVDPQDAETRGAKASLLWRKGESQLLAGKDPRRAFARGIASADDALRLHPDLNAYYAKGQMLGLRARWEQTHGVDPLATLQEAIRTIEEGRRIDPTWGRFLNCQASNWYWVGLYQGGHGQDPRPAWRRAEAFYRATLELPASYLQFNLAWLFSSQAQWEIAHGQDPRATVARAEEAAETSLAVEPSNPLSRALTANTYWLQAQFEWMTGADPQPSLGKVLEHAQAGAAHSSRNAHSRVLLADAWRLLGRIALEHGRSPDAMIREGWRWAAESIAAGSVRDGRVAEARLALLEADWRSSRHLDEGDALAGAQRALEEALRIDPRDAETQVLSAETHRHLAARRRRQGQPLASDLAAGLAAVEKVLAQDPKNARALAVRGRLLIDQGHRDEARRSLEEAIVVNRFLAREYEPVLEDARR